VVRETAQTWMTVVVMIVVKKKDVGFGVGCGVLREDTSIWRRPSLKRTKRGGSCRKECPSHHVGLVSPKNSISNVCKSAPDLRTCVKNLGIRTLRTTYALELLVKRKLDGHMGDAEQTRNEAAIEATYPFGPIDAPDSVYRMCIAFLASDHALRLKPFHQQGQRLTLGVCRGETRSHHESRLDDPKWISTHRADGARSHGCDYMDRPILFVDI
jgi:hypothetical protein